MNPAGRLDALKILYQLLPVTCLQLGVLETRWSGVKRLCCILTGRSARIIGLSKVIPRLWCIPRPIPSGFLALLAPVLVLVAVVIGPQVVAALPIRILEYRHGRPTTDGYRVSDGVIEHRPYHT